MDIVEYLFGNFWHFLELLLIALVISGGPRTIIKIGEKRNQEDDK